MQFEYDPDFLITEVGKRPGLWDYEHPDYRAKNVRVKLWGEVVRALMQTDISMTKGEMRELELQLQKKWKSIRDCFQKYLSNPNRTKRPYLYSKQLQFLLKDQKLPTKKPVLKICESSESEEEDKKRRKSVWRSKKKLKISKHEDNVSEEDTHDVLDTADDYIIDDSPLKADSSDAKTSSQNDTNQFVFANVDAVTRTDSDDPDKMFLLSLLPHLKSIPEEFRLNAKMELMQVLQQANYSVAKLI